MPGEEAEIRRAAAFSKSLCALVVVRVLVTGATGRLGTEMTAAFGVCNEVAPTTRADLDLTDHRAVLAAIHRFQPEAIINCAAYNDVDGAEDDAMSALQVNALAVRSLARAASQADAVLVHFSTDFVFDGTADRPYTEDDRPNPRSVYAVSKLLGEWFAETAARHYLLRVESLFGGRADSSRSRRRSSIERIVSDLREGREVRVFTDRTASPSYVADVVKATQQLFERRAPAGLYHCVNSGQVTWYDLARTAARLLDVEPRLQPVSVKDVQLRAARPSFSVLSNAKLTSIGIRMPAWEQAIERHIAGLEQS